MELDTAGSKAPSPSSGVGTSTLARCRGVNSFQVKGRQLLHGGVRGSYSVGFRFRVSDFGFRISGFGFWISDLRFQFLA